LGAKELGLTDNPMAVSNSGRNFFAALFTAIISNVKLLYSFVPNEVALRQLKGLGATTTNKVSFLRAAYQSPKPVA